MASILFYILSAVALLATLGCVTRRNPVHAVIFLVHAFFALAKIFYILGAPLVAAWEVIIYAGAIMVLFMFIIMMLELAPSEETPGIEWSVLIPVVLLSLVLLGDGDLGQASPLALHGAVGALQIVGLLDEARYLAVEAALAAGA